MKKSFNLLFLAVLSSLVLWHAETRANNIAFYKTIFNTDFVSAGVGGMRNVGGGTITLTNLTGTVNKAYLYWAGPMNSTDPNANATVKVNGQTVVGSNIGFSDDNCWFGLFYLSQAYRADITSMVAAQGNGTYNLTNFLKPIGISTTGININGASLLVFYDDGNPNNNRDVVLFDGNDSNAQNPYDALGWNVMLSGIMYTSGPVRMQLHVSDGQVFTPIDDDRLILNRTNLLAPAGRVFSGDTVPSANNGPLNNGSLWDIKNYDVAPYFVTNSLNNIALTNGAIGGDCVSLIVAAIDLPMGAAPNQTNRRPEITCQAPVSLTATGTVTVKAQVSDADGNRLAYSISVDGVLAETGVIPAGGPPTVGTLSVTRNFTTLGNHLVAFAVSDGFSTESCPSQVIIEDKTSPVIDCPTNTFLCTTTNLNSAVFTNKVTATDNFDTNVVVVCSPDFSTPFALGVTPVNCTATDSSGNRSVCNFLITVRDCEAPTIRCSTNIVKANDFRLCTAVVNYTVSATDNVPGGLSLTCVPTNRSTFPKGVTTVFCTAMDTAGNTNACSFTVTVIDTEPPRITCPPDLFTNTLPGTSFAIATYTDATAIDNCPGPVQVTCSPPAGTGFPLGTNIVTCTATDAANNKSASCSFRIIVRDNELPMLTCPNNFSLTNDPGMCGAILRYGTPMATDNVPGVTNFCFPPSGQFVAVGTTNVTCVAIDAAGNSNSCTFSVLVKDLQPPQLVVPADLVRTNDTNTCFALVSYTVTATDNCTANVVPDCRPPSGYAFPVGTTNVICTAVDAAGNRATNSFTVSVVDREAPSLTCPATLTKAADAGKTTTSVSYMATATDNCSTPVLSYVPPSGSTFAIGTNTVRASAVDAAGNSNSCPFLVVVTDSEKPTITCPASFTRTNDAGVCGAIVTFTPTVSDNLPGTTFTCVPPSGASFLVGTNSVTCTATDVSGNTASCTFAVTVKDCEAPRLAVPANLVRTNDAGRCAAVVTWSVSASDNCPGALQTNCVPPSGTSLAVGTNTVTCTAVDLAGNRATNSFTVSVVDREAPSITCPATLTKAADAGKTTTSVSYAASASDNCSTPVLSYAPPSGSTFAIGTNMVRAVAVDAAGNSNSCTFLVVVTDSEKPTITCPASFTRTNDAGVCGAIVTFTPTVSDNLPGTTYVCAPPSGASFPVGTNSVTCTATDVSGNTASCTFAVTVKDCEAPRLAVPANLVRTNDAGRCAAVVSWSVSASDNCPGALQTNCVPPSGSSLAVGTNTVTCTAVDASGNRATNRFTVTVRDAEAPSITCPATLTKAADAGKTTTSVSYAASASDNCSTPVLSYAPPSSSIFPVGSNTVTVTAIDAAGNSNSCTFLVIVTDKELPRLTCPGNFALTNTPGICGAVVTFAPTVSDNMPGVMVTCTPPSGTSFPVGTNTVTCKAMDTSTNVATCTFTISVKDGEAPALTLIGGTPLTVECHTPFVDPGATARDNCSSNLVIQVSGTVDANTPGSYVLTYSVTDPSGNKATATRTVKVVDTLAPIITLTGANPFVVDCNRPFTDPGATAADSCAGNLTSAIKVSGTVNVNKQGTYTLTYTVSDPSGNTGTATRSVVVNSSSMDDAELYPIALSQQSLIGVAEGAILPGIYNGSGPGSFGWLTWAGGASVPTLATSLTPPGDSKTYVNPTNKNDHTVSIGDWVQGKPGVANSSAVRAALDKLLQIDIIVPVWDQATGSGNNAQYHVTGFARMRLLSYQLPGQNRITARFLGITTCINTAPAPDACPECVLGYPYASSNLRTSLEFGGNDILRGFSPALVYPGDTIKAWYNDAHTMLLGVRQVIVKNKTGTTTVTNYPFSTLTNNPGSVLAPLLGATNLTGEQAGTDLSDRPIHPALFITDITADLNATSGDWQFGGTPLPPHAVFGTWKAAVRTVDNTRSPAVVTVTPDANVATKNNWNLGAGDAPPAGLKNEGYGAEVRWNVDDLGLIPGHNYRLYFMIHDGDPSKAGNDVGHACVNICVAKPAVPAPKAVALSSLNAGKRTISWLAQPGKTYRLQYKNSFTDANWIDLPGTLKATGWTVTFTDDSSGQADQRFYRAVVIP